jgi:hypothetical protein
MNGSNNPHIHFDGFAATHPFKLLLLNTLRNVV